MWYIYPYALGLLNTLRPRQNGCHFADSIFNCILVNENIWIPIKISLKFVPKGSINNIPTLVQIMAWRRPGDKPLSEPMMVNLPTHICVTGTGVIIWLPQCQWSFEEILKNIRKIIQHHSKTKQNANPRHNSSIYYNPYNDLCNKVLRTCIILLFRYKVHVM